jgi:glyoxylase-like metal-dependent hydrolase (beta-lactamase superfamily II)
VIEVERHGDLTFFRMARRIGGFSVYWTGAYLLEGVLVDCGPPATAHELDRLLAETPLSGLVITHHHEDHMGAAQHLARSRDLTPHASSAAVALLRDGYPQEIYRRIAWGRPPRLDALPLGDVFTAGRLRLQVVPTPGHSPDHVCFFEEERGRVFTGDLFLAERLRYLRQDEDVDGIIASLDRVLALPVREVLCAHRGPVRDGPAALRRKRDHLAEMRDRIRSLVAEGVDEKEIARRVVGPEGLLTWTSCGHFSARNFVRGVRREDVKRSS